MTAQWLTGSQARGVHLSAQTIAIHLTLTLRTLPAETPARSRSRIGAADSSGEGAGTSAVSTRIRVAIGKIATAIEAAKLLASVRDIDSPSTQVFACAYARRL